MNSARSWPACSKPSRGSARSPGIDADPPRRRLAEDHVPPHPARSARSHRRHRSPGSTRTCSCTSACGSPMPAPSPNVARHLTDQAATSIIGAAAECPALENVVVRSGIEIYGRGRGALTRPDETAPISPTSEWGRTVAEIEHIASRVGDRVGVSSRRRAARTGARPARAVAARADCCACRSCRSACSPTRRSP